MPAVSAGTVCGSAVATPAVAAVPWAGAEAGAADASVRPSARMFSDRTVIRIARPGKSVAHQPPARRIFCPYERMLPQLGFGSWTPAPMKDRLASKMIASATSTVANTITGAAQLIATCLSTMWWRRAPMTFSAAT